LAKRSWGFVARVSSACRWASTGEPRRLDPVRE
jgi:hypothetical protein